MLNKMTFQLGLNTHMYTYTMLNLLAMVLRYLLMVVSRFSLTVHSKEYTHTCRAQIKTNTLTCTYTHVHTLPKVLYYTHTHTHAHHHAIAPLDSS